MTVKNITSTGYICTGRETLMYNFSRKNTREKKARLKEQEVNGRIIISCIVNRRACVYGMDKFVPDRKE
jgi:hypothetical protein